MMQTTDETAAAIAAAPREATLARVDDRWVLTMTRQLRHPVERVWPMLVDPAQLVRWSPVVPDRVLDTLGPATSRETPDSPPVQVEVLVSDAPRELVHRWGDGRLRWTLRPVDGGTELTLEHTFDHREESATFAAGWHICLCVLGLVVDGDAERVVGPRSHAYGWAQLREEYDSLLG